MQGHHTGREGGGTALPFRSVPHQITPEEHLFLVIFTIGKQQMNALLKVLVWFGVAHLISKITVLKLWVHGPLVGCDPILGGL